MMGHPGFFCGSGCGAVEEADSGYTGGSGGEALGGIFECDSAEGVDRDGGGGCTGFAEAFEASAGGDLLAGDGFFEDRSEEDGRNGLGAGPLNFSEGVAGDGDDRVGQVGLGVTAADVGSGGLVWGGGEMDAVRGGSYGDARVGVDEEASRHGGDRFTELTGQQDEIEWGEIFFAELDEIDAFGGPAGGLADEGGLLG